MTQAFGAQFIAGGVVSDAAGNVINDDSAKIAEAQTLLARAEFDVIEARSGVDDAVARVIQASMEVTESVAKAQEADVKKAEAAVTLTRVEAEVIAAQKQREGS